MHSHPLSLISLGLIVGGVDLVLQVEESNISKAIGGVGGGGLPIVVYMSHYKPSSYVSNMV